MKILIKYIIFAFILWVAVGCIVFRGKHRMATSGEFLDYWWEVITFQEVRHLNMRPDMNMNTIKHTILLTGDSECGMN